MEEEKKFTIYLHRCPNGKCYVGMTSQKPIRRWANGKGYKHNSDFSSAIEKYGWGNIEHIILEEGLTMNDACKSEKYNIKKYNCIFPNGYNIAIGGEAPWCLGIPMKDSVKKILTSRKIVIKRCKPIVQLSLCGEFVRTWESAENIKNELGISSSLITGSCKNNRPKTYKDYIWMYESDYKYMDKNELEEKIKEKSRNKGKKPIVQLDLYNNLIEEFETMKQANKKTGFDYATLRKCCNDKTQVIKENRWMFLEDYIKNKPKIKTEGDFIKNHKQIKTNKGNRKIIYEEKIFYSISDFSLKYGLSVSNIRLYLSGKIKMPNDLYNKGLRYFEETIEQRNKRLKRESKNSKTVVFNGFIYDSITQLYNYYKFDVGYSQIIRYLSGNSKMPQKYIDRGLRYYNPETDKDLPIYQNTIDTVDEV